MQNLEKTEQEKYLAQYRSRDWKIVREQVFKIDRYICQKCFRSRSDGITLQVHHKQYFKNKKPWDYPLNLLETICKGCHAAEHGIIPPRDGWDFYAFDDLGDLSGNCDKCNEPIRYVYSVGHPRWHVMEVGVVCCDKLTNTQLASEDDKRRRSFNERKKTFISSTKWRKGLTCCEIRHDQRATFEVVQEGSQFRLKVNRVKGKKLFPSVVEAKAFAFDWKTNAPKGFAQFLIKHPLPVPF